MKTAMMEKIVDQPFDLSITHEEKKQDCKTFWSKGGANE
jgi:hypothetical protein